MSLLLRITQTQQCCLASMFHAIWIVSFFQWDRRPKHEADISPSSRDGTKNLDVSPPGTLGLSTAHVFV